ncbi:hypothetical protein TI39_contig433g00002 [Zymoseptoria brevis]|uniref:Uncharacterized protein n=1 Tax=Zymoseptoria brevis TaxID=1047168 RepID=A0A0F4GPJ0_9PEZI|nr:hypothetical protein TI39_contig433g00002 [Zymoseptoria brevis]
MGPPVGDQASVSSIFDLLPSPADSVHDVFDSPNCAYATAPLQTPDHLNPLSRLDDTINELSPEPGLVKAMPVTTPPIDDRDHPNMNLLVGGALAPMPSHPPILCPSKSGPSLRLPSFDALGIAAPHPDRLSRPDTGEASPCGLDGTMEFFPDHGSSDLDKLDALYGSQLTSPPASPPRGPHEPLLPQRMPGPAMPPTPLPIDVASLTPPVDSGDMKWTIHVPVDHIATAPPSAEPLKPSPQSSSEGSPAGTNGVAGTVPSSTTKHTSSRPLPQPSIDGALDVLLDSLQHLNIPNNPLRVLSHALPSPSPTGHYYPAIIDAIHERTTASPTVWINVFHAIQGRFNLADLPTSPPSTPGPPIDGDDYFTQKVFDSAVCISDYQEDLSSLPRSPRPVVPPSSINVSVVERYIPPSSSHEFSHMFNPKGPSVLVDRLVELSPDNGTLLFVYPTRVGAQTFMQDYLGPLLDPLLRSIVVVNGLSSDVGRTLGNMPAANSLPDYDQLHRQMKTLCNKLSQRGTSTAGFHGQDAAFSLVHASKQRVRISREAWASDWWAKQEKPRIREVMTKYAQEAQKRSSNEHIERAPTPTELIQQLLEGVCKKPYPSGQEPTDGIEVSVFIIKRGGHSL